MNVNVMTRDGAVHHYTGVRDVVLQEPGGPIAQPAPGRLVLMAVAVISWMVVGGDNPGDSDRQRVDGSAAASESIDLVERDA